MKITGTRGYIDVEYNGKTARFNGELTLSGFYAEKNTIRWEPPHNKIPIDEKEKNEIINEVLNYSKDKDFKIYFE